jgi:hypothetical protein
MRRLLPALAAAAFLPLPLAAQGLFGHSVLDDPTTCAAFLTMGPIEQRDALRALPVAGDAIDFSDATATNTWIREVEAACNGHGDRPLVDAATEALGAD